MRLVRVEEHVQGHIILHVIVIQRLLPRLRVFSQCRRYVDAPITRKFYR